MTTLDMPFTPQAPSNAPRCPRCQTSNTEQMTQRSASDADFNYFCCNACGHMWIVAKAASSAAS